MPPYHALDPGQALEELGTTTAGLSSAEAEERRSRHGPNELPEKRRSRWRAFLAQFQDILIYILFAAMALTIVLPFLEGGEVSGEDFLDAAVIAGILIANAALGYYQEAKAEGAIAALRKMSQPHVRVRRDGQEAVVPSRDLVPGDVVILSTGDRITADGRLFQVNRLEADESALTGESVPEAKVVEAIDEEVDFADRINMVFSGSFVTAGSGSYLVTATGLDTELGRIARLVQEAGIPETPLTRRLRRLSWLLGIVVVALSAVTVVVGVLQGRDTAEIILTGASLAVASVPEGLPAVTTVAMAIGVSAMAGRKVLVRRMESLETLGNVTVICTDKTGTVTENRMEVVETWVAPATEKHDLLLAGASCSQAELPDLGDPVELALLRLAEREGVERLPIEEVEVPFDSTVKHMRTRHDGVAFIKGAPEVVAEITGDESLLDPADQMAGSGLRVLALAEDRGDGPRALGVVGMEDPPRVGVKEAVEESRAAGIRTILITGDHAATASSIAERVGITGEVVEGRRLDAWSETELAERIADIGVFARVSPEHKMRILRGLVAVGEVAAMTGDGVNDAPALRSAHVGMAMGVSGTDIARESADIVLADDHYASIVNAVREGRRVYDNIKRVVVYLLKTNLYELVLIGATLALAMPLPYLPIHLLLINLMTDSLPAIALATEGASSEVMGRPPRPRHEGILHGESSRLVTGAGLAFVVAFFLFRGYLGAGVDLEVARTVTVAFAVVFEMTIAYSLRSVEPAHRIGFFSNRWLNGAVLIPLALLLVLIYTPANQLFRLTSLRLADWGLVAGLSLLVFAAMEGFKYTPLYSNWSRSRESRSSH